MGRDLLASLEKGSWEPDGGSGGVLAEQGEEENLAHSPPANWAPAWSNSCFTTDC